MGIFTDSYPGDREEQKDKHIAELEEENNRLKEMRPCGAENPHRLVPSRCPTCGETLIPACCIDFGQDCYRDGKEQAEADLATIREQLRLCNIDQFNVEAELEGIVAKSEGMLRLAWNDIDDDFPDEVSEGDFEGYVADLERRYIDLPQGPGCECERCSALTAAGRDLYEGEGFVVDRIDGILFCSPEPSHEEESDTKPRLEGG